MADFRELDVWRVSIEAAGEIYRLAATLPDSEKFGIRSQLTRAAVSISSNIAEGHGRESALDFARFLRIAQGSTREYQSLLEIARYLGQIQETREADELLDRVSRMLYRLIQKLINNPS